MHACSQYHPCCFLLYNLLLLTMEFPEALYWATFLACLLPPAASPSHLSYLLFWLVAAAALIPNLIGFNEGFPPNIYLTPNTNISSTLSLLFCPVSIYSIIFLLPADLLQAIRSTQRSSRCLLLASLHSGNRFYHAFLRHCPCTRLL